MRSTLGPNIVNELRIGMSGGPTEFSPSINVGQFTGSLANQMGYCLGISAAGISDAGPEPALQAREATTESSTDTLTWLKGSHSMSMGCDVPAAGVWVIDLDARAVDHSTCSTRDPALRDVQTRRTSRAARSNDRNGGAQMYAVLVGSVSAIDGRLGSTRHRPVRLQRQELPAGPAPRVRTCSSRTTGGCVRTCR